MTQAPRLAVLAVGLVTSATAHGGVIVSGGLSRTFELEPGQSESGTIELIADASGWTGRVYLADFHTTGEGRTFPPAGTDPRSNAAWVRVPTDPLTLAPDTTTSIPFAVDLPTRDDLTGSYWSVILFEEIPAAPEGRGMRVAVINRIAVRITTNVKGTGEPKLEFLTEQVAARGDARSYVTEIRNTGDRVASTTVMLSLTGDDGRVVEATGNEAKLLPGCSALFEIPLPTLRSGDYSGLILAEPEGGLAFGKRVALSYDLWGAPMESP